jgi:hypothetical protein
VHRDDVDDGLHDVLGQAVHYIGLDRARAFRQ